MTPFQRWLAACHAPPQKVDLYINLKDGRRFVLRGAHIVGGGPSSEEPEQTSAVDTIKLIESHFEQCPPEGKGEKV